jgi:hypothetical protein
MGVFNAKDYKLAKVFCSDLEIILRVVDLAIRGLEPFKRYKPVSRLIFVMKEEKVILESHYDKYKQVKKDKGKIKNEK